MKKNYTRYVCLTLSTCSFLFLFFSKKFLFLFLKSTLDVKQLHYQNSTPPISPQHVWLLSPAAGILVGWLELKPIDFGPHAPTVDRLHPQELRGEGCHPAACRPAAWHVQFACVATIVELENK